MDYIIYILKGVVIGIANAIPGVSGGTMAVILKIYDRLVDAISLSIKKLKENWKFLLCIGIGALLGIFFTSILLSFLFNTYTVATPLFFLGIIVGSVPAIWNETVKDEKFKPINIIPLLIGVAIMLSMAFINRNNITNTIVTTITPMLFIKLIIVTFLSAIAMIIPGISGDLLMTMLGSYQTVITAVSDLNILILIPVAIGAGLGILSGSKIISLLLKKYHQGTYCAILGIVAASVFSIFPKNFAFNTEGIVGLILVILGIIIPNISTIIKKYKKV